MVTDLLVHGSEVPPQGSRICPVPVLPVAEPLEMVAKPTAAPDNVKVKVVPRGKVVGFRCGTSNPRLTPKVRSELTWLF